MTTKPQTNDTIAKIDALDGDSTTQDIVCVYDCSGSQIDELNVADLKQLKDELLALRRLVEQATVIELDFVNQHSLRKNRQGKWRLYKNSELGWAGGTSQSNASDSALQAFSALASAGEKR